jgi:hypothetical protein
MKRKQTEDTVRRWNEDLMVDYKGKDKEKSGMIISFVAFILERRLCPSIERQEHRRRGKDQLSFRHIEFELL